LGLKLTPTCLACDEYRTSREMYLDTRENQLTLNICA